MYLLCINWQRYAASNTDLCYKTGKDGLYFKGWPKIFLNKLRKPTTARFPYGAPNRTQAIHAEVPQFVTNPSPLLYILRYIHERCLFNDAVCSSHYMTSSDRMISEWWIGKDVEGSGDLIWVTIPVFSLSDQGKLRKPSVLRPRYITGTSRIRDRSTNFRELSSSKATIRHDVRNRQREVMSAYKWDN
jgi:hypothetical protein